MSLDPHAKKVLELLQNIELSTLTVEQLRTLMQIGINNQIKYPIYRTQDLEITYNNITLPCRLYQPSPASNAIILYFHGGGFTFGTIELFDNVCRQAANASGCNVLSVEYRLAPEHKFPAAVDDAYHSYLWLYTNSHTLGIDKTQIAIAGDSAGANLATVTCIRCKDTHIQMPKLQVLFYPVVAPDMWSSSVRQCGNGYFLTRATMKWFTELYLSKIDDFVHPYLFPLMYNDHSLLPEAIIVTAEYDPLRDQGEMYSTVLCESNVPSTCIQAKGMIHGFLNFTHLIPAASTIAEMVWSAVGKKLLSNSHDKR